MTDTQIAPRAPAAMPAGGSVMAIVPQTFEEIQRIANTIIAAGLAPSALLQRVKDDATPEEVSAAGRHNTAAVASAIMAGAELNLPPMVALRSFTVINGKPALYADGNVAVVRKARGPDGKPIVEYIRHGYEIGTDDESTYAWCEAKRADNGEMHREVFSIADARRAGLWQDEAEVIAEVWAYDEAAKKRKPTKQKVPNPAPWYRFPKRMMMWRAVGYCLRWLFADVLGGMVDEYEARDIEAMVDITPAKSAPKPATLPEPDEPPPPGAKSESQKHIVAYQADDFTDDDSQISTAQTPDDILANLEHWLSQAKTETDIEETWSSLDVESEFSKDRERMGKAVDMKIAAVQRVELKAGGEALTTETLPKSVDDLFPGDRK